MYASSSAISQGSRLPPWMRVRRRNARCCYRRTLFYLVLEQGIADGLSCSPLVCSYLTGCRFRISISGKLYQAVCRVWLLVQLTQLQCGVFPVLACIIRKEKCTAHSRAARHTKHARNSMFAGWTAVNSVSSLADATRLPEGHHRPGPGRSCACFCGLRLRLSQLRYLGISCSG